MLSRRHLGRGLTERLPQQPHQKEKKRYYTLFGSCMLQAYHFHSVFCNLRSHHMHVVAERQLHVAHQKDPSRPKRISTAAEEKSSDGKAPRRSVCLVLSIDLTVNSIWINYVMKRVTQNLTESIECSMLHVNTRESNVTGTWEILHTLLRKVEVQPICWDDLKTRWRLQSMY